MDFQGKRRKVHIDDDNKDEDSVWSSSKITEHLDNEDYVTGNTTGVAADHIVKFADATGTEIKTSGIGIGKGTNSVMIGDSITHLNSNVNDSVLIGQSVGFTGFDPVTDSGVVAIGSQSLPQGTDCVAIGTASRAYLQSVSIGASAGPLISAGIGSTSVGYSAESRNNYSIAIGYETDALGDDSIAIGRGATASSTNSIAVGQGVTAPQDEIVIGNVHTVMRGSTTSTTDLGSSSVKYKNLYLSGSAYANTISESTTAAGVSVDGVLLKDSQVNTNQINELTATSGVTIDGVLLKDSQVNTNQINELTASAGVTIDGVLLKDNRLVTTRTASASGVIYVNNSNGDASTNDYSVVWAEMYNTYNAPAGDTRGRWNYKLKNNSVGGTGGLKIAQSNFLDICSQVNTTGVQCARLSSVGTWTTFSDEKVKKNITEIDQKDALSALDSIRPVHYCYKFCTCERGELNKQVCHPPEGTACSLGFLANEVKDACGGKFASVVADYGEVGEEELKTNDAFKQGDHVYGLNQGELTPIIWSILKNLKSRIEALESR